VAPGANIGTVHARSRVRFGPSTPARTGLNLLCDAFVQEHADLHMGHEEDAEMQGSIEAAPKKPLRDEEI